MDFNINQPVPFDAEKQRKLHIIIAKLLNFWAKMPSVKGY